MLTLCLLSILVYLLLAVPALPAGDDKREPHPLRRSSEPASSRSQEKGPPQGERKLSLQSNNRTARPEEPPSSGGVPKGAAKPESRPAAADGSSDTFVPSEKVSEDLPVAFPVDI